MSKEERQIYDSNWKAYNDYEYTIAYATFTRQWRRALALQKTWCKNTSL